MKDKKKKLSAKEFANALPANALEMTARSIVYFMARDRKINLAPGCRAVLKRFAKGGKLL